jgi:cobalt-zinc-cadmium resistance protein CzcA
MKQLISFCLVNRLTVVFFTVALGAIGVRSYLDTPIEAFPDVTNTQIVIVTQWPGRSAQEVERFVTVPIEIAMNSVQKKTSVRSVTMFGLSVIKIVFEDEVEDFYARQQVNNQLINVNLPDGADPEVQPPFGPTGVIFRYTLKGKDRSSVDLLTIQNWTIDRHLRAVAGVADVASFGGAERAYEIVLNPPLLHKYDLTPLDVYDAVSRSNLNVGGDVIEKNGQAFVVRGVGLLNSIRDIENLIVKEHHGVPVLVKSVAEVRLSHWPRVGQAGLDDDDDVLEGIVIMRKNENTSAVLKRLKEKIRYLNESVLPKDVKIVTFYDRDNLMNFCTRTVLANLTEGILFVTVIVFLFMFDWRATVTVSLIIPLSLLFAFMCMRIKGMSANLLSMGAIDFGIIIDGAVVMVEGLFVALALKAEHVGMDVYNRMSKLAAIRDTAIKLARPIFFSKLIIITCLLPIFAFEKVEGKMFSPLAFTLAFALLGALIFTLTLVPAMVRVLFDKNVREKHNPVVGFFNFVVSRAFKFCWRFKRASVAISVMVLMLSLVSFQRLGSEFLPTLNEGALWVEAKLPMSSSLSNTVEQVKTFRRILNDFDEVESVLSQVGRSNDGTDPSGFFYVQCQVNLKPKEEWKRKISYEQLIEEMNRKLNQFPGIVYNFSQPIIDAVAEAVAGINASLAVKIFGADLEFLNAAADSVAQILKNIRGIKDLGIMRIMGQPELTILLNEEKMALYGVTTAAAQAVIEMAVGGKAASTLYEGNKKFAIRIRYPQEYRSDESQIAAIKIPTLRGNLVPLNEIAEIKTQTVPGFIYRDNNVSFIAVKFSVRERDMGSTIAEAQEMVNAKIVLPQNYRIEWAGEFENQQRAVARLTQVVPVSLLLIFVLLFVMFGNAKDSFLVLLNVPFALIGGIFALHLTGTVFSISAGVGFIALFGICIQNGVILISVFKDNLRKNIPMEQAIYDGVYSRIRPVVMTALMAAIGLLPAALSTGIGSETQKPLAIVVIGGLASATVLTLLVFPIIFSFFYRTPSLRVVTEIQTEASETRTDPSEV